MRSTSTILFVDDEELVIKYFRKAFGNSFKIETANRKHRDSYDRDTCE